MAETNIQWTSTIGPDGVRHGGFTFNPWRGCTEVSPECAHCYAKTLSKRNPTLLGEWGDMGTRVVAAESYWNQPYKWNKLAQTLGVRLKVFCASIADVFEDWTGAMTSHRGKKLFWYDENGWWTEESGGRALDMGRVRKRLFKVVDSTPWLDWLFLTKRPENIERMVPPADRMLDPQLPWFRLNLWLGTTVGTRKMAIERIPHLLDCRDMTNVLFLSCEPLLENIEFADVTGRSDLVKQVGKPALDGIDWVIVGGESGKDARVMNPAWARSIRDLCKAVGVPFFFKQHGEWVAFTDIPGDVLSQIDLEKYPMKSLGEHSVHRIGVDKSGRRLDGVLHDEYPDLSGIKYDY